MADDFGRIAQRVEDLAITVERALDAITAGSERCVPRDLCAAWREPMYQRIAQIEADQAQDQRRHEAADAQRDQAAMSAAAARRSSWVSIIVAVVTVVGALGAAAIGALGGR